jgi:hypothetical protein
MKRSNLGSMLAGSSLLLLVAASAFAPRAASSEEGGLEVSLRLPYEVFSQPGPIDAVLRIQNRSQSLVELDLGLNHKAALVMTFQLPNGMLVKRPYPQPPDGFGAAGNVALSSGQSYEEILVLNDWEGFEQPGSYEVEVQLPPVQEPAWRQRQRLAAAARFRVVPRDPARLEATCRRLEEVTLGKEPHLVMDAAHALSFAADPACLPSLIAVFRNSFIGKDGAIRGLARLGSPAAVAALVSAWDDLRPHFREYALIEFGLAGRESALREALRRAGKKEGPP